MKRVATAFAALLLVPVIALAADGLFLRRMERLEDRLEDAWTAAVTQEISVQATRRVREAFERDRFWMALTVPHDEIEAVASQLSMLEDCLTDGDDALYREICSACLHQVQSLRNGSRVCWQTVL